MTMKQFIKKHRAELDRYIRGTTGQPEASLNDNDREEWVLNDELLYKWALREGVPE